MSPQATIEVYSVVCGRRPPAFHLPVRRVARTGEEEGAGGITGGWSSNPGCPEGRPALHPLTAHDLPRLGVASGRPYQCINGGPANATSVIAFQEASSKSAADWSNANHYGEGVAQRATGRASATCARQRARSASREKFAIIMHF